MSQPVETFDYRGLSVEIHTDDDARSPRSEYDHTARFVLAHRRYDVPNESGVDISEHGSLEETLRAIQDSGQDVVAWLPVYGYEHGGLTVRAGQPFACQWDSGVLGLAYVTREAAFEGWGSDWTEEVMLDVIRTEVEEYDQYLTGQVYGYVVLDRDGETLDSCWGLYGSAYAEEEAREAAHGEVDHLVVQAETEAYDLALALETPDVATALRAHAVIA